MSDMTPIDAIVLCVVLICWAIALGCFAYAQRVHKRLLR